MKKATLFLTISAALHSASGFTSLTTTAMTRRRTTAVSALSFSSSSSSSSQSRMRVARRAGDGDESYGGTEEEILAAAPQPPSRPFGLVSALPVGEQQAACACIGAFLFFGSFSFVNLLNGVQGLSSDFFDLWRLTFAPVLGLIFAAAGATHFTNQKDYAAIVPPEGTWGFFTVPTPGIASLPGDMSYEDYHVFWTGVAELTGGLALLAGGLGAGVVPKEFAAFCLLCLTVAVTPANIYMFTHDAQMGELPEIEYPNGHAARAVLQCVLIGLLWKTAFY